MAAVADNKKIKLDSAEIQVEYDISEGKPWVSDFHIRIDLGDGFSPRERKILFNSARLCEVHKILTGEFTFSYQVAPNPVMPNVYEHNRRKR